MKWCAHFGRDQFEEEHRAFPVHPELVAFISITDPRSPDARIDLKYQHVLRLKFHDMPYTRESVLERYKHDAKEHNRVFDQIGHIVFPAPEHARQIVDFIKENREKTIIAHCEAGVSRSAAVCKLLHKLGWDYKERLSFGYDHANELLYGYLLDAMGTF